MVADRDGGENILAPVIPLFGGHPSASEPAPAQWRTTWTDPDPEETVAPDQSEEQAELAASAEAQLLRRLRTRSLSLREAQKVLSEAGLDADTVQLVLGRTVRHGYLDDARLAEQLIHTAVERKGQGRMAITQTLAGRGIPREVIDAVLAELPDDEQERALEFARTKVRGMRGLDRDTALRRLSGQLARRGYAAFALSAARQAIDEGLPVAKTGVRFE